jgi:hypothetical protein
MPVRVLSLYEEGQREAERHKWIESQKQGKDLGQSAVDDWYRRYWPIFCRIKCLEHLHGNCPWHEFEQTDFGMIGRLFLDMDPLLAKILDHAQNGKENLDIIVWAIDSGEPTVRVCEILEQLHLNRAQLHPKNPPHFALPGTIQAG